LSRGDPTAVPSLGLLPDGTEPSPEALTDRPTIRNRRVATALTSRSPVTLYDPPAESSLELLGAGKVVSGLLQRCLLRGRSREGAVNMNGHRLIEDRAAPHRALAAYRTLIGVGLAAFPAVRLRHESADVRSRHHSAPVRRATLAIDRRQQSHISRSAVGSPSSRSRCARH
jgi:hypothetical protein